MKFLFALLLAVSAFSASAQASSRDERALTKLAVEAIDASELDATLNENPSDLNQVKNVLVRHAIRDSEVVSELLNIRSVIAKARAIQNANARDYQLKIAQYRLLWLAGELGYVPQNR